MSAPVVNVLPEPPVRSNAPVDFSAKADAFLAALPTMVVQINASLVWINERSNDISGWANAAAGSAEQAGLSAGQANTQRVAAQAAAAEAAGYRDASQTSAGQSAGSASVAGGHANAAALDRHAAEEARESAEYWAGQAQETVTAGIINDDSLLSTRVRSALDASRGHFRAVPVAADAAIAVLDWAEITATGAAVTVTLPADPDAGQLVMVSNKTQRRDHRIAVGSTPVKGQDVGGFILIDKPSFTVTLKYMGPVYGWEVL